MDICAEALRRLVAGTLMPGFVGTTVPAWIKREYAAGLGAVCLYGDNVAGPEQLAALCRELRLAAPSVLIGIDEEGGDVTRLHFPGGSPQPGNAVLGRLDDEGLTRASAAAIGAELAAYGINLDLAPVVDVNSAADNPVIGTRSFGAEPALVARHSVAYVEGMQSAGVAACAKHFPGHGDTHVDSHRELPRLDVPLETLHARELEPFRAVVAAGCATVMTSHIVVAAVDDTQPATFSRAVLQGLLRDRLGFGGVLVTDALDMAGASAEIGVPEAAVRALAAGGDLLCLGSETSESAYQDVVSALVAAVGDGRLDVARLDEAAGRVAQLAASFALGPAHADTVPVVAEALASSADIARGFEVSEAARAWLATDGEAVMVQVASETNLAAGSVTWGPASAGFVTDEAWVPSGAKVAVAGRALDEEHQAWGVANRLRAAGHPTIVVECGWPRGGADVVTFGGSPAVARALAHLLGVHGS